VCSAAFSLLLHRRALSITEEHTGSSSADTAAYLGDLGCLLQDMGDWAGAEQCFKRALAIMDAQQPPDYPGIATALSNQASLLQAQGRPVAAKDMYQQAIDILESHACSEQAMATRIKLAVVLCDLGGQNNLKAAEGWLRDALQVQEAQLGLRHADTIETMTNLASVLHIQRSVATLLQAEELYQKALDLIEIVKGPMHPDTATALNNLAWVQQELAQAARADQVDRPGLIATRLGSAKSLYSRALDIREQQLGPNHPDTGTSCNNLASLLQIQGTAESLQAAEPLYNRALCIFKKHSVQHPDVAMASSNLAALLQARGELQAAERLQRKALAIWDAPSGNPNDIATALNNLGTCLKRQGRLPEAQACYKRAVSIAQKSLGPDDANRKQFERNLNALLLLSAMATVTAAAGSVG
jgi:tetratricopeptide (TPR) repeat protein